MIMTHPKQFIQALRNIARDGACPQTTADHLAHAANVIHAQERALRLVASSETLEEAQQIANEAL